MIRGTGGAEDALVGFLRTAISGVVAGLEISCGVAMTASYGIEIKRIRTTSPTGKTQPLGSGCDLCDVIEYIQKSRGRLDRGVPISNPYYC
jgi:hypothetical protein